MSYDIVKKGYMCSTDFWYHIEGDAFGCKIYPSEKALREGQRCVNATEPYHCGIVEVYVTLHKEIQKDETDE